MEDNMWWGTAMRRWLARARRAALLALCLLAAPASGRLVAIPIPMPGYQDRQVWLNTRSGVYHCPGSRYYGNTKAGKMMPEATARARGHRPAYGRSCGGNGAAPAAGLDESPTAVSDSPATARQAKEEPASGPRVWVNTRSGVYHCPGTRYYGATAQGRYMTQAEARAAGYRAAYGRTCR